MWTLPSFWLFFNENSRPPLPNPNEIQRDPHQRTLGGPFCAKQTFKTKVFFLMWKDICINEEKINMIQDQKKEDCLSMIAFQQNIDIQTK